MQAISFFPLLLGFMLVFTGFQACKETSTKADPASPMVFIKDVPTNENDSLLKFTEGLRSILHDQQGNIWFASHQEGVAKWDGSNFTYYTMEDGLSDNQVRNLFMDQAGNIWFECGRGLSTFDGKQVRPGFQT